MNEAQVNAVKEKFEERLDEILKADFIKWFEDFAKLK